MTASSRGRRGGPRHARESQSSSRPSPAARKRTAAGECHGGVFAPLMTKLDPGTSGRARVADTNESRRGTPCRRCGAGCLFDPNRRGNIPTKAGYGVSVTIGTKRRNQNNIRPRPTTFRRIQTPSTGFEPRKGRWFKKYLPEEFLERHLDPSRPNNRVLRPNTLKDARGPAPHARASSRGRAVGTSGDISVEDAQFPAPRRGVDQRSRKNAIARSMRVSDTRSSPSWRCS